MSVTAPSLKAQNRLALASVLLVDVLIVMVLLDPVSSLQDDWQGFLVIRSMLVLVIPVMLLLLNSLLPAALKAMLVFWRWKDALPGHRAFSEHTLRNPRIDADRLRQHVGPFPTDPAEQNRLWCRLLWKVEGNASIAHLNGQFLLLRDLACLSVLLLVLTGIAWAAGQFDAATAAIAVTVLAMQYLLAAISARRLGHGLVASVLTLHGAERHV